MTSLRIDGVWATGIAAWGGLEWVTKSQGGMHEITWSMDTDTTFRHPALRTGVLVEVFDGPARIGAGTLQEPDVASGSFVAMGLYRSAERFLCLDGSGNGTSIPNTAIDQAIVRGLPWKRRQSFFASRFTPDGATDNPAATNYLNTLLDGVADQFTTYWLIDRDGYVLTRVADTEPTWLLPPGLTDLGVAEDEYASDLYGRRLGTGGTFAVNTRGDAKARAAFGRREAAVDLTPLGIITQAKAEAILDGMLAKGKARPAFTESVEVSSSQLLSIGGVPADLSMVEAGQVVRSYGFFDDIAQLDGRTYLDWLIGETKYADGSDTIMLSPQGLAPRDLAAVLASLPARQPFRA